MVGLSNVLLRNTNELELECTARNTTSEINILLILLFKLLYNIYFKKFSKNQKRLYLNLVAELIQYLSPSLVHKIKKQK